MASPEEEIEVEIAKAQAWYSKKYNRKFDVIRRYDKFEKKWSWQVMSMIGNQNRVMQFGLTTQTAEGPMFETLRSRVLDYLKSTLTKAHVQFETEFDPALTHYE